MTKVHRTHRLILAARAARSVALDLGVPVHGDIEALVEAYPDFREEIRAFTG